MRMSACLIATVALAALANTGSAKDDFSALLADLSFNDAPAALSQEKNSPIAATTKSSPGLVASEQIESLKPAPRSGRSIPSTSHVFAMPLTESSQARVSLHDPVATEQKVDSEVDFGAAFVLQEMEASAGQIPAQTVGFGHHLDELRAVGGCKGVIQCTPHVAPNLPSSTLLQYFRSNKCYTNVWDGYQQPCGGGHKHIHGQCDCFEKSRRCANPILPCDRSGCVGCDAGCDR